MAPQNQAAWLRASQANPLDVGPAPYTTPGPRQLVIKNGAVGINQVEWAKQLLGDALLPHITYPIILGADISGTVAEVGEGVTRFNVGDRVVAAASSITFSDSVQGGFQLYTVVSEWLAAPLPEHVSYEAAAVLPLPMLTAAHGLFDPAYLALDLPTVPARATKDKRVVIITGGASAVGSSAIQFAVAAGYDVVSTSSPKNFDYVKKQGASSVFDYKSDSVIADIAAAVKGRPLAGGFSIGDGSADILSAILSKHEGRSTKKFIALAGGNSNGSHSDESIAVRFIMLDPSAVGPESVTAKIYANFLPQALADRQFVPAPEPQVAGKGLEAIQGAFGLSMQGVSAKKIVVSL